ncbi:MAG: LuxR family transcriptional regulator [Marmoricola sp.]|nr:LuxR family transcriptional regulator [Marmoricola sp.]
MNISLTALAREQLELALTASSGRSAHTVFGGPEHVLRQNLIALAAGHKLNEHENSGDATVHVLHGQVRVAAGDVSSDGASGHLIAVPDAPHTLEALEDVWSTIANALWAVDRTSSTRHSAPSGSPAAGSRWPRDRRVSPPT